MGAGFLADHFVAAIAIGVGQTRTKGRGRTEVTGFQTQRFALIVETGFVVIGDDRLDTHQIIHILTVGVDAAQHQTHIRHIEAFAVGDISIQAIADAVGKAEVGQQFGEFIITTGHITRAVVIQRGEIIHLQFGGLVTRTTGQLQAIGQGVIELGKRRVVVELHFRHPGTAGHRQCLFRFITHPVKAQHPVEFIQQEIVTVPAQAHTTALHFNLRLIVDALRQRTSAIVLAAISRVLKGFGLGCAVQRGTVEVIKLTAEVTTGQITVAVAQRGCGCFVAVRIAHLLAFFGGGGNALIAVARYVAVITAVFQIVTVEHQLHTAGSRQIHAQLQQQIKGFRIHQVAVGFVNGNFVAVGIVVQPTVLILRRGQHIVSALLALQRATQAVFKTVTVKIVAAGQRGIQTDFVIAVGSAAGNKVDDAAGCAQPHGSVGTVYHFNPFNQRRVDGEAVTRAIAQRVGLRNTIHQNQRRTATETLRRAGHFLARRRKAWQQAAQCTGQIAAGTESGLQGFTLDDRHHMRDGSNITLTANGGDRNPVQRYFFRWRRSVSRKLCVCGISHRSQQCWNHRKNSSFHGHVLIRIGN